MIRSPALLKRNEDGSTTIEFTIVMLLFFLLTFGITEFGYLFWQYNSAAKAAQVGARLAAVSNPVWGALPTLSDSAGTPGGAWQTNYAVTCTATNATASNGTCTGTASGDYSATAMQCLVFGRATGDTPCDNTCGETGIDGENGICDRFPYITPQNVSITYAHTGMGFSGRPGGPVPTITLQLTGLTFEFFALGGLMGFDEIEMPDFKVTMTGEDLNRAAP